MDLNHILLFIAVISPLVVLARAWRPGGGIYRGWRIASLIVLVIAGISWIFFRQQSGYVGGGAWFALLFVPAIGLRKVTELAAQRRYKSARKLASALLLVHPSAELRQQVALFRELESAPSAASVPVFSSQPDDAGREPVLSASRMDRRRRFRNAPAVIIFIMLNAIVFLLEISFGDWTDFESLRRFGALEPYRVVVMGEYWRLFSALFLHVGAVHLFFNLFALYVLGPGLERSIGSVRFAACYLISGLGSSAGVVLLAMTGVVRVGQVVGASGCIMGIIGAWAGFLLRHRHAPRARERLLNILLIIAIQTVFDITTPQVSTAAHVCGLVTGFFVGLALTPRAFSSETPWPATR